MNARIGRRMRLAAAVLAVAGTGSAARADLLSVGATADSSFPALYRYSNAGQYLGLFPDATTAPKGEGLNGLTKGPDGAAYVLSNVLGGGSIVKVTLSGTPATAKVYSETNAAAPKLFNPGGLAFDSAGTLHVSSKSYPTAGGGSSNTTRVYAYAAPNSFTPAYTASASSTLADVAFDADDNLYVGVVDSGIRKVVGGLVAYTIPTAHGFNFTFGPDGNLYVASRTAGVLKYDPATGAALGAFVAPGAGGLTDAQFMTFGDDGVLYVNDRSASVILKYDAVTGAPLGTFLDYPTPAGQFAGPFEILQVDVPEPGAAALAAGAVVVGLVNARRRRR